MPDTTNCITPEDDAILNEIDREFVRLTTDTIRGIEFRWLEQILTLCTEEAKREMSVLEEAYTLSEQLDAEMSSFLSKSKSRSAPEDAVTAVANIQKTIAFLREVSVHTYSMNDSN